MAVVESAKKLNQTSELVVPVAQAGAGAQGSMAVVGSYAAWLDKVAPPLGQAVIHEILKTIAFEKLLPPPRICAWELREKQKKRYK